MFYVTVVYGTIIGLLIKGCKWLEEKPFKWRQ
jgi:hypothetical protein